MNFSKRFLALLTGAIAVGVLAVASVLNLPATASAAQFPGTPEPTGIVQAEEKPDTERLQAIADCLPDELALASDQGGLERFAQALGEMGNDQFERALNLTDSPSQSPAERQFVQCLRDEGALDA